MMLERLYDAAARAGFLETAVWQAEEGAEPETAAVEFRAPDEAVLDGLGLSTDYAIRYPMNVFVGLVSGHTITIDGQAYRVREIRVVGDGTEKRATLTRL